jgi:hypothetical protein
MLIGLNQSVQKPQMKTTSDGRRPQNIKNEISQQPTVGSFPNFKLMLIGPNQSVQKSQIKTTSNGRRPQNIKIELNRNL